MIISRTTLHNIAKCAAEEPSRYRTDLIRIQRQNPINVAITATNHAVLVRVLLDHPSTEGEPFPHDEHPVFVSAARIAHICEVLRREKRSCVQIEYGSTLASLHIRGVVSDGTMPTDMSWLLPLVPIDAKQWPKDDQTNQLLDEAGLVAIGRLRPQYLAAAAQAIQPEADLHGVQILTGNIPEMIHVKGANGVAAIMQMQEESEP